MLEWCYQWDDPRFVENYYKNLEEKEEDLKEKTGKELEDLLREINSNNEMNIDDHVWKRAS